MKTKHTPKPWEQHKGEDGKTYATVRDATGQCVADCGSRTDEKAQANAQLIAAAPDLLEACEGLAELNIWLLTDECECPPEGHHCGVDRLKDSISELDAAINKAKG